MTTTKLFDLNNPNDDIFNIPTELGPDENDNMCAMIGDATMHHLSKLSPFERQAWEHYILVGGQYLFTTFDAFTDTDPDTFNLKTEDVDNYFENNNIDPKARPVLEEAIQNEKERREKSEDIYDRASAIPYADWEQNPGLFSHFDTPTTPNNKLSFAGNTKQSFYDFFPEGHPDEKTINSFLNIINRDIDSLDDGFLGWAIQWLEKQNYRLPGTLKFLSDSAKSLSNTQDPDKIIEQLLLELDQDWMKQYRKVVKERLLQDPMSQLIELKNSEWEGLWKEGISPIPSINLFNKDLFRNFRKKTRRHHWARLKKIKKQFIPSILVKGLDLNKCRLSELSRTFNLSHQKATEIWFKRPFTNLEQIRNLGILQEEDLLDDWKINKILTEISDKYEASGNSTKSFSELSMVLVKKQKEGLDSLNAQAWNTIWRYYRSKKNDIIEKNRKHCHG